MPSRRCIAPPISTTTGSKRQPPPATLENFQLIEDTTPLTAPSANVEELISDAFLRRPELLALNYQYQSARKFQSAERDLLFPTFAPPALSEALPCAIPCSPTGMERWE